MFPLQYYTLSLFFGGIIALVSAVVVYYYNPKRLEAAAWLLVNVSSAIWSFGYLVMIVAPSRNIGALANFVLHAGAIFIPIFYLLFVISLVGRFDRYRGLFYSGLVAGFIFSILNTSPSFVRDVLPKGVFHFAPDAGPWYGYFTIYFFGLIIAALGILLLELLKRQGTERQRLGFIFIASLAGFAGGGSVFFLTFNVNFPPYPLALYSFYPFITTYAILRHKLFNVKVIATEFLTFGLWIVILSQLLLANTFVERITHITVFLIVSVLGIFLIRSVQREVAQREKIETLATELAAANEELKKLDAAKSEFISLASHQLRAPLTVIKGYVSMLLEGTLGPVTALTQESMKKVDISTKQIIRLVGDLLDLSRIETGRLRYNMKPVMLDGIVSEVVAEVEPSAKQKGLRLQFVKTEPGGQPVNADADKIREVIMNLIDNAIKYTATGEIRVELAVEKRAGHPWVIYRVTDSGIGIKPADIPRLFTKFSRTDEARRIRADGMGLGLYLVKRIIEDHGGEVSVTSPGIGQGSTFTVALPGLNPSEASRSSRGV